MNGKICKKYRCPRCIRDEIIDYDNLISCVYFGLDFDKRDLDKFDEEDILAISEKRGILRVLLDKSNNIKKIQI